MVKVLWLIPESMNMEPVVTTLEGDAFVYTGDEQTLPPDLSHEIMIEKANELKPDLIMYVGVSGGPYFPKAEVFKQMPAPIVHFCCDAGCPGWEEGIKYYSETKPFAFTVNIDGNDNWLKGPKDLTMWCPVDPRFYTPQEKTIRFGWAGGVGSQDRKDMIQGLGQLVTILPRNEEWGSYREFADFLSSCKITFNMARSGSGLTLQRKNRVTEAGYAKCLLLEERGAPTSNYFELGTDYFDYGSCEEIKDILNTISDSDIDTISTRFQKKVLDLYHPDRFWEKVLSNF